MRSSTRAKSQRGAALISLVAALLLLLGIGAGYLSQAQHAEHHALQARQQSIVAATAAEAGLNWFEAHIQQGRLDERCEASSSGQALRDALLVLDAEGLSARSPGAVFVRCVAAAAGGPSGWSCRCDLNGPSSPPSSPSPPAGSGEAADPASSASFVLKLAASPRPGVLRIKSTGCAQAADCRADVLPAHKLGAVAELESDMALLSPLQHLPQSALTVRGLAQASPTLMLHKADTRATPSLAGQFSVDLQFTTPNTQTRHPSCLPAANCLEGDRRLLAQPLSDHLLGMSWATLRSMPAITPITCPVSEDCGPALQAAQSSGATLLYVAGEARIQSPLTLGSVDRPVLLILDGPAQFESALELHGLIHAEHGLRWQPASGQGAGRLVGALLVEGHALLSGELHLQHDPALLRRLQLSQGSWIRLPGGWTQWQ